MGSRGVALRDAIDSALDAFASGSSALVLAPTSTRGWFDGRGLVATGGSAERIGADADPQHAGGAARAFAEPGSIQRAGAALERAMRGDAACVAVLATYEGDITIAEFSQVEVVATSALQRAIAARTSPLPELAPLLTGQRTDLDAAAYVAGVEAVRQAVAAGDVYVLNLTRRISGGPAADPLATFATLLARGGAEMSAAFALGDGSAIASISPERFVSVATGSDGVRTARICPIKGTRARGDDPASDSALARELAEDPKELAEHLMVVDLERNDLGRVCAPGTVRVDPLYEVVPTPYCHQLVSRVSGELRADASIGDLLEATFPCGSVTGAPKIAAVRIAEELEASPRGAYCGALLVAVPGRLDSSVLIRTLEFGAEGAATWGTGCGITYESDARAEWAETELKASPVLPLR